MATSPNPTAGKVSTMASSPTEESICWTVEIESSVSADRMFRAAILDWHNLGPTIEPEVHECGTEEGNLRQPNFTSVVPFTYMKEFVDRKSFECESTIMEGYLGTKLESASTKYKILDATAGDGCIVKVETTTKSLPGIKLDDEAKTAIEKAKEGTVRHFKIVEAYLLANPDKYNAPPVELYPVSSVVAEDELAGGGGDGHEGKTEHHEHFTDNYQTTEARYVRGWGMMMKPHTGAKPAEG